MRQAALIRSSAERMLPEPEDRADVEDRYQIVLRPQAELNGTLPLDTHRRSSAPYLSQWPLPPCFCYDDPSAHPPLAPYPGRGPG